MQNDSGELTDLYIPRKCSATNVIISAKDHAAVQINVADVDPSTGRALATSKVYVFSGALRAQGEVDDSFNRLAQSAGILSKVF